VRIRTKFLALILIVAGVFLGLSFLSVRIYQRIGAMRGATDRGVRLIAQSIRAHGLMKDVVFDIFSPRLYSSLQGIVMSARGMATQRDWLAAVDGFRSSYDEFMADPEVRLLARGEELREAYALAGRMSQRAFKAMDELRSDFDRIGSLYPDEEELYARLLQSKDESLYDVFDKVRSASFYLGNIFESYLSRFVSGLELQAQATERRMLVAYASASIVLAALAAAAVLVMTRSILANIKLVDRAMERISEGDFSSRVSPQGHDELGLLASRVNLFAERLKGNVDSLVGLLGELNLAVPEEPDPARILSMITDAALRDGGAECAAIYVVVGGMKASSLSGPSPFAEGVEEGGRLVAECVESGRPVIARDSLDGGGASAEYGLDPGLRSVVAAPLVAGSRRPVGACVFGMRTRPFTDLELSRLLSFADYAAQLMENMAANAALRARSDAEYRALQSQIQPHFMYNVLNGLVALNRKGEREGLERSIHALRDMLRYTVGRGTGATVADEFAFLERYCRLQKLRFEERLSYSFDLDPEAASLPLPKLLVQPLLENAVLHGVEPSPAPASVSVRARVEAGRLSIEVADDGVGCDASAIREREGIGIGNVRERLSLLYPGASLDLESAPGAGFRARIGIPLAELAPRAAPRAAPRGDDLR
jgi:HAMP domain-containing protein